jgi:hypothetical protein
MIQRRAKRICLTASLLVLTLTQSFPAAAQGTEPPKLVVELKAITDTIEGLREKSADSAATGGGKLEGAILSAYAIQAAADEIKKNANISENIVVAGYGDIINSDIYAVYQLEYAKIRQALGGFAPQPDDPKGLEKNAIISTAIGTILPAFSALLRSETEVSSLGDGLTDSRLLASAVAKAYGNQAIILTPPTLTSIREGDETIAGLDALKKSRDMVAAGLPKKNPNKKKKAAVDAADAFFSALYTADKDGRIKLLDVIKARQLATAMKGRKLLRVKIENSSGTLLKRKNLWVALGAPSVAASGGLIATYALDEGNGSSVRQGMVLCQAGVKNLRTIHKLDDNYKSRCKIL